MIIAALQPGYLPWLGFFDLMKRCDVFVIEDSLKYTKQDWRNRNRIRTRQGWVYLTVPVEKGATGKRIRDVSIDNSRDWASRHYTLLRENYRHAPYWDQYAPFLEESFRRSWTNLHELDLHFIEFFAREFQIATPRRLLSELGVEFTGDKTGDLVDLARAAGGTTFIEGSTGKSFVNVEQFQAAGLEVLFQVYDCRPYPQQFEPFVSHLSAIDLLLNLGPASGAHI